MVLERVHEREAKVLGVRALLSFLTYPVWKDSGDREYLLDLFRGNRFKGAISRNFHHGQIVSFAVHELSEIEGTNIIFVSLFSEDEDAISVTGLTCKRNDDVFVIKNPWRQAVTSNEIGLWFLNIERGAELIRRCSYGREKRFRMVRGFKKNGPKYSDSGREFLLGSS